VEAEVGGKAIGVGCRPPAEGSAGAAQSCYYYTTPGGPATEVGDPRVGFGAQLGRATGLLVSARPGIRGNASLDLPGEAAVELGAVVRM